MESTRAQHQPINQPLVFLYQRARLGMAQPETLFRPKCSVISSCHGSGAGPLLPGAHRKYILYGCESWETLPPASRLTTAYQSLNRGDSTLGGLGRAAASPRLAGGYGNGIGWAVDGATFLNPSGQPGKPLHGLCVFKFGLLSFCRVAGPQCRCVSECVWICVSVCFADHDGPL